MKILILILSLSFTINVFGQDNLDSGFTNKIEARNLVVNGKKEGKWVEYVEDYKMSAKEETDTAINTIFSHLGQRFTTDPKAPYYRLTIYKLGKPFGIVHQYYRNGKLECEIPYTDGKINGMWKKYNKKGKLLNECPYTNGKENGTQKSYDNKGRLIYEFPFTNGYVNGVERAYYSNGKISLEVVYYNNGQIKSWKEYKKNGNLKRELGENMKEIK